MFKNEVLLMIMSNYNAPQYHHEPHPFGSRKNMTVEENTINCKRINKLINRHYPLPQNQPSPLHPNHHPVHHH